MFEVDQRSQGYGYTSKNPRASTPTLVGDFKAHYVKQHSGQKRTNSSEERVLSPERRLVLRTQVPTDREIPLTSARDGGDRAAHRKPSVTPEDSRFSKNELVRSSTNQRDIERERVSRTSSRHDSGAMAADRAASRQQPGDVSVPERRELRSLHSGSPYYNNIMDDFFAACALFQQSKHYRRNETILPVNDTGTDVFFILHGACDVYDKGTKIKELREREFFGELGMFHSVPSAFEYVAAGEDCQIYQVAREALESHIQDNQHTGILRILKSSCEDRKAELIHRATRLHRDDSRMDDNNRDRFLSRNGSRFAEDARDRSIERERLERSDWRRERDTRDDDNRSEVRELQEHERDAWRRRSNERSIRDGSSADYLYRDLGSPSMRPGNYHANGGERSRPPLDYEHRDAESYSRELRRGYTDRLGSSADERRYKERTSLARDSLPTSPRYRDSFARGPYAREDEALRSARETRDYMRDDRSINREREYSASATDLSHRDSLRRRDLEGRGRLEDERLYRPPISHLDIIHSSSLAETRYDNAYSARISSPTTRALERAKNEYRHPSLESSRPSGRFSHGSPHSSGGGRSRYNSMSASTHQSLRVSPYARAATHTQSSGVRSSAGMSMSMELDNETRIAQNRLRYADSIQAELADM